MTLIDLIVRSACEAERYDQSQPDSIVISVDALTGILQSHLLDRPAPTEDYPSDDEILRELRHLGIDLDRPDRILRAALDSLVQWSCEWMAKKLERPAPAIKEASRAEDKAEQDADRARLLEALESIADSFYVESVAAKNEGKLGLATRLQTKCNWVEQALELLDAPTPAPVAQGEAMETVPASAMQKFKAASRALHPVAVATLVAEGWEIIEANSAQPHQSEERRTCMCKPEEIYYACPVHGDEIRMQASLRDQEDGNG